MLGLLDAAPMSPRVFYVLLTLAEGDSHGYALSKSIEAATGGTVRLTPGTLYPLIKQLLADGWISELLTTTATRAAGLTV